MSCRAGTLATLLHLLARGSESINAAGAVRLRARGRQFGPPPEKLGNIRWLHVPKTGTSFISTIWAYACSGEKVLELRVDPNATTGCSKCYDFALMDRYPRDLYCEAGALHERFQTQHAPLQESSIEGEGANYIGLFRDPSQRLISAKMNGFHVSGFTPETYRRLRDECANGNESQQVACYARFPGVAGCTTRLLAGDDCSFDCNASYHTCTHGEVPDARGKVHAALGALSKMKFVGLTEEWEETVCLFHLMFGGRLYSEEFKNEHHDANHRLLEDYDTSLLGGFVDEADEIVYQAAKDRFWMLRNEYTQGHSACSVLTGGTGKPHGEPGAKCAQTGVECGEVDESGDCGACPALKLRFLPQARGWTRGDAEGARPQCHRGACSFRSRSYPDLFRW